MKTTGNHRIESGKLFLDEPKPAIRKTKGDSVKLL